MANFSAQVDDDLIDALNKEAKAQERTTSAMLRIILRERYGDKKKK